ncbi:MAG TPA: hypothetical protein VNN99_02335 [Vicinamibacterales bacterium]|nr:hypothetical protein [Vicinamibacterales bacterium]
MLSEPSHSKYSGCGLWHLAALRHGSRVDTPSEYVAALKKV